MTMTILCLNQSVFRLKLSKGAIVESWEYDDRIKGASTLPISPVSEHGKEVKLD